MKKLKFIIKTAVLFAALEFGMWGYSQWIHGNIDMENVNFLEVIFNKNNEEVLAERLLKEAADNGESTEQLEELLELLEHNPEMKNFIEDYPNREKWKSKEIQLTKEEKDTKAPLFLQWDRRWGYSSYGNKMLAVNGCGPTCLAMVLVGLLQDEEINPKKVAEYSEKWGYVTEGSGTDWGLMTDGAKALGLNAEVMPLDKNQVLKALRNEEQIICSMRPGDFTTTGHFIVVYGEQDGKLLIHDPNSKERSSKKWEFDDIKGQIKNLWRYSPK